MAASAGTITFTTAIDNSQLEKDVKAAEREVKDLQRKMDRADSSKSAIEAQMESAEAQIHETEAAIDGLMAKKAELDAIMEQAGDPYAYMDADSRMRELQPQIDDANKSLEKQVRHIDVLNDRWQQADTKSQHYGKELARARQRQDELGAAMGRSYRESSSAISGALESAEERFSAFGARINSMMKKVFLFSVILAGINMLKEYLASAMAENEELAGSFNGLKATISGFAAGLVGIALPAITAVIRVLTAMVETLARAVDMIFSTNIMGAIQSARQAAQATKAQAKASKDLAKSQKDANKQLMAFDEINRMDDRDDTGTQADSGGAGEGPDPFSVSAIDDALAEIMVILGAALLAVGAILCFSGINIPLGITLMAIGALMVYTAAQENWGALPEEVRAAITGVLVVTGAVMLALGAILALSGAAVPIGIGLMAAGAALLWTAAALNWSSMPGEVKGAVSVLLAVLSGALIVIGAILCFSGGGTPLGIALMAAGAASLAAVAALNWDAIPEQVRTAVSVIAGVVSVALLVVGAILAFAFPGSQALGIGLLAVGAATLAANAALNWDAMPTEVQNTVSRILAILGGALVVLGVLLLCTGAAAPLGIALIAAGAGSMAAAIALNWDFLVEKLKSIWGDITSFWRQNISRVFTEAFWRDVFKCIVNGLIWMVNSGLSAFGDFVNSITSGISGILGAFDIDWSFSFSMPQIPYLAQGAVIPPNRKFMAVLGDQTSGRNLEAPEGLIRQIVREESGAGIDPQAIAAAVQNGMLSALMQGGLLDGRGGGDSSVTVVLQVGTEELARAVAKGNRRLAYRGEAAGDIVFV